MRQSNSIFQTNLSGLELLNRGKVRDMYDVGNNELLIIATDRLSAFDVVLDQPIPGKGGVLTRVTRFWLSKTQHIIPNHLSTTPLEQVVKDKGEREMLGDRAMVVRKLNPLPVEAIVRGYLIGSGWKDYQNTGSVCGIRLQEGLQQASRLPEVIYTPSTKAGEGEHDENIDFDHTVDLIGGDLAKKVREVSLRIYTECAKFALTKGIIIADTKFEFGLDDSGNVVLIDEVLTPDSSRFWPVDEYRTGISPPSFDKQIVRNYLETLGWDKTYPAPKLPSSIIEKTARKYREVEQKLTTK